MKREESRPGRDSAFTLVELLTVIVVISILAGLLLPAVARARDSAKKSRALVMANNIIMGMKLYYNEYGCWPNLTAGDHTETQLTAQENEYLYRLLIGTNVNLSGTLAGSYGNARSIRFFDFKASDVGKVNTTTYRKDDAGTYNNIVNPWGNSFVILIDYDGDNKVSVGGTNVNDTIAVWSGGGKNNEYSIISWK